MIKHSFRIELDTWKNEEWYVDLIFDFCHNMSRMMIDIQIQFLEFEVRPLSQRPWMKENEKEFQVYYENNKPILLFDICFNKDESLSLFNQWFSGRFYSVHYKTDRSCLAKLSIYMTRSDYYRFLMY